ncbi:putative protein-like [Thraustotheca clavata]|uniref:Peroxisomal membrane protein n=1 Tax=Thraustotheca clavata TaxID=74557 RepID=A0A1W0AAY0_9STRA|nr:putative protein-like [Thraustotheca clavata]
MIRNDCFVRTKALTSASIGVVGEIIAHGLKNKSLNGLSTRRMAAFGLYGGVMTAPIMHLWYGFLEKYRVNGKSLSPTLKLLLDRLVLTPPFLTITMTCLSLLTGSTIKSTKELLRRNYVAALMMNWKVWTCTQYLSFNYIPPHLRVFWGNIVALWWNCYLSLSS